MRLNSLRRSNTIWTFSRYCCNKLTPTITIGMISLSCKTLSSKTEESESLIGSVKLSAKVLTGSQLSPLSIIPSPPHSLKTPKAHSLPSPENFLSLFSLNPNKSRTFPYSIHPPSWTNPNCIQWNTTSLSKKHFIETSPKS